MKSPATIDLDTFIKPHALEERIYRMRCVEGVVDGRFRGSAFPLADVIKRLEPQPSAKFVEFTTLLDPSRMPGQRYPVLQWPYVEGLRMDEAMNPLTLMVGRPVRRGAAEPERRADPARRPVEVRLQGDQVDRPHPVHRQAAARIVGGRRRPREYGFYANVNPKVDHPRWSQATERRLGEFRRRKTEMFNGYGDQVASLYTGMDLRKNY